MRFWLFPSLLNLLQNSFFYLTSCSATLNASSTSNIPNATLTSSVMFINTSFLSALPTGSNISLSIPYSSASASSSSAQPTQTLDPTILQEIEILQSRRLGTVIGATSSPSSIPAWLASLDADGKWPDSEVDYTTGCAARRANWPAETHWQRLVVMAAAWRGGLKGGAQFVKDADLHSSISLAMDYWFGRDFTNLACLDSGGTAACPCSNPDNSLWNTNWFSNIILIPELVSQVCLLLNDTLVQDQLNNCTHMTLRSYGTLDHNINGVGFLTGANMLDVAKIGIDEGLLISNVSMLTDAYRRVHSELQVKNGIKADSIRADGSFGQHAGILYNGNYGKDYTNDVLDLEVEAGGTTFAAGSDSQQAFGTLFKGDQWMIFFNSITGILHWDFSALGRFISFPVIDSQATASININLTEVQVLGQQWGSAALTNFASSLSSNSSNANAGQLIGNRMFFANDYMVQRGSNYVSTLKMYSQRTLNTECTNSQNPEGFHLSDGVHYTYLVGNEYEDIAAAWDWNLIPGITVDYGATPLECGTTQSTGIESFVGGVSDGQIGIAVMRYTNPLTASLHWQKAWFFLDDDVQHVMIANISSSTNASVLSVLDQRLHSGTVVINSRESNSSSVSATFIRTLWHGSVGYVFPDFRDAANISVQVGIKSGSWATIGTSTQPPATVDLFSAWIVHNSLSTPLSYTAFPGVDQDTFIRKSIRTRLHTIQNDGSVSAVFDEINQTAMFVFWDLSGGLVTFRPNLRCGPITVNVTGNIALIYKVDSGEVTISDPSQSLTSVQVSFIVGPGEFPPRWKSVHTRGKTLFFQLPSDGLAGSSVNQTLY